MRLVLEVALGAALVRGEGLARRILGLPQRRRHVLHRLDREAHLTGPGRRRRPG